MCQSNKRPYANAEEANQAINGPLRKYGRRLASYNCPFCNAWHVKTIQKKGTIKRKIIKRAVKAYISHEAGLQA